MFNTPILYIIFNRLDTVQRTFPEIRKIKPLELYIAADGPRTSKPGEDKICNEVKDWVLSNIDWDCNVHTLFRKENLGCGIAPYEAITWFFENVEEGIILEDDCVPSDDFFKFTEILLKKYRDDERIMQISGTNRLGKYTETQYSYVYTNYPSEWGWATWKRAWNKYDFSMKAWNNSECKKVIRNIFYKDYWYCNIERIFDQTVNNNSVSWWDYQWEFIKNINNGLSITPAYNLVTNIGNGEQATHTTSSENPFINLPVYKIEFPLKHPEYINTTPDFENQILDAHFTPPIIPWYKKTLIFKILKRIYRKIKGVSK